LKIKKKSLLHSFSFVMKNNLKSILAIPYKLALGLLALAPLAACEQVIELDTPAREAALVVSGQVTDQVGGTRVTLTTSLPPASRTTPPPVSGATVRVVDQERNLTEILREAKAGSGIYEPTTANFRGRVGGTYRLEVVLPSGQAYESGEERLAPVTAIDTIYSRPLDRPEPPTGDRGLPQREVAIDITDPAGERNFYRFFYYVNDSIDNSLEGRLGLTPDEFFNGQQLVGAISFSNRKTVAQARARVEMLSISREAYEYLNLISRQVFTGGLFATPPEPLRGNIFERGNRNRPAFGYFSASAVVSRSVVVGE
jgi:Domain of unknown function (DUF4249)